MTHRSLGMLEVKEVACLWFAAVPKAQIAETLGSDRKTNQPVCCGERDVVPSAIYLPAQRIRYLAIAVPAPSRTVRYTTPGPKPAKDIWGGSSTRSSSLPWRFTMS